MVVWVFAGGGQAELGVIPWLQGHFPEVKFERRTPQRTTPGPRPGVGYKRLIGQTGPQLDKKIKDDLEKFWNSGDAHVLLLLDDTDCHQPSDRDTALRDAVTKVISKDVMPCVAVALAVPELEVWLIADWNNTLAKERGCNRVLLRKTLADQKINFENPEEFDCYCDTENYRKISEILQEGYNTHCGSTRYSKDTDTRRLFKQVDPNVVLNRCPHFKSFWLDLQHCLSKGDR